jgi:hypothetical protein
LAFARDREIRLLRATYAQKIDICTDRQVHISNWSDRKDKREYLRLGY